MYEPTSAKIMGAGSDLDSFYPGPTGIKAVDGFEEAFKNLGRCGHRVLIWCTLNLLAQRRTGLSSA